MNSRDAFAVGFLLGCAEAGLTGKEAVAVMEKAARLLEKSAEGWLGTALNAANNNLLTPALNAASTAAVALPVVAGAGAGYLAHKLSTPDFDEDDVRKKELIEELRKWARRAREHQHSKALRAHMN